MIQKQEKVNLYKQFRESNKIDNIKVPVKYSYHPTLEAEAKKKKEQEKAAAATTTSTDAAATEEEEKLDNEAKEAEIEDEQLKDENEPKDYTENGNEDASADAKAEQETLDEAAKEKLIADGAPIEGTSSTAAPTEEKEKLDEEAKEVLTTNGEVQANGNDDNIEQLVKETPIELVDQPVKTKYEPVELPNKETLDKFKDKPAILRHYTELNAIGVGSIANKIEDPNKVVELGSGLRMTQQQLLDIAAKRVAPVITNINDSVSKSRQEDEIKRQQQISEKVKKHENKLQSEFEKYLGKIGKRRTSSTKKLISNYLILVA